MIDLGRIGIWTGAFDAHPSAAAVDAAKELEVLGFGAIWIPEAVGREPFVAAARLLAGTSSIKVATGIANIYARDPMTMAGAQKTLAEAYPDRFLLGMGVSHHHLVARLRRHDYSRPLAYMREYLAMMDEALFHAIGPAEAPDRVIAALGPKMLELAAERTNGAHPYFVTPDHTAFARTVMGPHAFLAPEQMVVLDTNPTTARATARAAMHVYLRAPNYLNNLTRLGFDESDWQDPAHASDRLVDAIVAWGSIDAVAERIRAHLDAGADHVCLQALRPDRELPLAEWRSLALLLAAA